MTFMETAKAQLQQQQQQQQGRVVSPVVSPVPPRQYIAINPGQPNQFPNRMRANSAGPMMINHNTMAWQQHQQHHQQQHQQQQLQQSPVAPQNRSLDCDENDSDVSSIPWGSIRPDPNYDPAKDPTNPDNIDKPFVAPLEITIRTVRGRRRKTMGGYNTSSSASTRTPPHSSDYQEQLPPQKSDWLQQQSPQQLRATHTGSSSVPMLGMSNDSTTSHSDMYSNNSFSGSTEGSTSAEQQLRMQEDLLDLHKFQGRLHHVDYDGIAAEQSNATEGETPQQQQRKGMVLREFGRRVLRFNKKKKSNGHHNNSGGTNNMNNTTGSMNGPMHLHMHIHTAFSSDNDREFPDQTNNQNVSIDDALNPSTPVEMPTSKPHKKKGKSMYNFNSPFANNSHSKMMTVMVGQENGC
mmetsp:Transcript_5940/g.13832  ORF Transcript_5940/g.13832 Transcript_5940/m.13832 type:complete len:407 (-) Transcript_5940:213-1433(-)